MIGEYLALTQIFLVVQILPTTAIPSLLLMTVGPKNTCYMQNRPTLLSLKVFLLIKGDILE